jgi:hypothetical protein
LTATAAPSPRPVAIALQPLPPKSFQDRLRDVVRDPNTGAVNPATPDTIWKQFEPIAIDFLITQLPPDRVPQGVSSDFVPIPPHVILANPLWMGLQEFLDNLQKLIASGSTTSSSAISSLFERQGADRTGERNAYQGDLADLFLALLIVRRGGPSNLDKLIRNNSPPLWDIAEILSDNPTLQQIADRIRAIQLLKDGPPALTPPTNNGPAETKAAIQSAFQSAMNSTLLLPAGIFAPLAKPIHGVGFREFHVVKQHIRGYQFGEIAKIENILKGEARDHATKHTLSNERDTFLQTETTTETDKELTSTDHVDIKNETQNQVKEDTKVDAGIHAQYSYGNSFKLGTDLGVSYDKASDETKKFASDVAKDVTQKAVSKVTEKVTQNQTTKIIETFEETEDLSFDNKTGQGHISGIYQWVEKVYLAQVFNTGRHLLLDLMVPEPGASLLALATIPQTEAPVQPDPLGDFHVDPTTKKKILDKPLAPADFILPSGAIDFAKVDLYVGNFQVTGIDPPPDKITVTKAFTGDANQAGTKTGNIDLAGDVKIDEGYQADTAVVSVSVRRRKVQQPNDGPGRAQYTGALIVIVGRTHFPFGFGDTNGNGEQSLSWVANNGAIGSWQKNLDDEQSSLVIAITSENVDEAAINVDITCIPSLSLKQKWVFQAYSKIVTAWQQLQSAYETKIATLQLEKATVGPLGAADPETNRLTERIELKRACVAIMDNDNTTVRGNPPNVAIQSSPGPFDPSNPQLPEPVLPSAPNPLLMTAQDLGERVRWFEQAFEWENIAYVFYPYFWGRRSQWIQGLNLKNDDPIFLKFLQAGYARVVVPVRLGFELAALFYLNTGLPWLGGNLPPVGDDTQNPLYLDIAEEIKSTTGGGYAGSMEEPLPELWDIKLPTTLIKLRTKDDQLPSWTRLGLDGKPDDNGFPSDPPIGPWTWNEQNPPKAIPYLTS